ncbi:MAG: hypothetical protein OQK24_10340 [Magnetovibrio sp.]|nr:hypothetical protein [Magnetovibrio sp.]
MAEGRKCVVITPKTGKRAWEVPAGLWSKVGLLRRIRLSHTVTEYVLPVLQSLEELYLKEHLGATPRIVGRSATEIEKDDVAIEACLYLFDLALQEGLLEFQNEGKKGKPGKVILDGPVGRCGYSIEEAKAHFLDKAVQIILQQGKQVVEKTIYNQLERLDINTVEDLGAARQLVRFDPLAIKELSQGLKGDLEPLLLQDKAYLDILHKCKPITFLRALRYALGKNFSQILKWDPEFISAVAEGLNHGAKITAMGPELLSIEDPEVIRAFGTWAMKEVKPKSGKSSKKKKYITRIAQVKEVMGASFSILLTASPNVVKVVGNWSNQEIDKIRNFLPHLGSEVIEVMSPMPFEMQVSMLEGLWDRLGREFVENELKKPEGAQVVKNITDQAMDMMEKGNSAKNLRNLITQSDLMDASMGDYLKRKRVSG